MRLGLKLKSWILFFVLCFALVRAPTYLIPGLDQRLATDMSCPGRSGENCKYLVGWRLAIAIMLGGVNTLGIYHAFTSVSDRIGSDRISKARVRGGS